jgi:indolepyruvate ferredoxin oxidoreductase beta subunit
MTKPMSDRVINIVVAGLGGQGVLKASDILTEAAFAAGWDVKKADVHGMSQRGGSVRSDVRFGPRVFSPMVTAGEADFLVVLAEDQVEPHRDVLRSGGTLLTPDSIPADLLPNRRSINVALLGVLSRGLAVEPRFWREAICNNFREKLQADNLQAFEIGRGTAR